jgi:hypothetical protein
VVEQFAQIPLLEQCPVLGMRPEIIHNLFRNRVSVSPKHVVHWRVKRDIRTEPASEPRIQAYFEQHVRVGSRKEIQTVLRLVIQPMVNLLGRPPESRLYELPRALRVAHNKLVESDSFRDYNC